MRHGHAPRSSGRLHVRRQRWVQGSSRGSSSRSSTSGSYRAGGPFGGTRSRFRAAGRTSPVRVAAAAAAGAAVALTADGWYASAYRRSNTDNSEEELDYYNRTNYFDALSGGSCTIEYALPQLVSLFLAALLTLNRLVNGTAL
ncbi:hypothetical protein WMY93_007195 [Mugilogobius chulae]|uniref:Shadow of prion protein n=1 Tax=Mugilogobius chulae TaxID=88201 RepID=A0AAW0PM64_9GOBI